MSDDATAMVASQTISKSPNVQPTAVIHLKPRVTIAKTGLWTPRTIDTNSDIFLKLRAQARALVHMSNTIREESHDASTLVALKNETVEAATSLATLMGGKIQVHHPLVEKRKELREKLHYSIIILEIMKSIEKHQSNAKTYRDVFAFLGSLRTFVQKTKTHVPFPKALPSETLSKRSIMDVENDDETIRRDHSDGLPAHYHPPLALKEAAAEFLRVPMLDICGQLSAERVINITKSMGIINLTTEDKLKSMHDLPDQTIYVRGTELPKCAIMYQDGKSIGTYRRVDYINVFLKADEQYLHATKYEIW